MLGKLKRVIRAHLEAQGEMLAAIRAQGAELTALRTELAALRGALATMHHSGNGQLALQQYVAAMVAADGRHSDPLSLPRYHAQVYSQNGEDGILAEIFRRIEPRDQTFVEIGIEGGIQNNTRLLLEQGWTGVWIEGSPQYAEVAAKRMKSAVDSGRLKIVCAMATPDGIEQLLDQLGVPPQLDLLSVDIDQHTTHVWKAIQRRARVVCIEYNASLPPASALEVPYDPSEGWANTNWFGGGLGAIERIGAEKGLHLVGCDGLGINAFLVDAGETAGKFRAPFTAVSHYQPPLLDMVAHLGHYSPENERVWKPA